MITLTRSAAILSLLAVSPVLAEVEFAIGEPVEGSVRSGIGQISGWAVSDRRIVSVEAFIDGVSLGTVPYGGSRLDVAAAYPAFPDAEHSGWAMKWNYALHEPGEHLLTIVVTEDDATEYSRDVLFYTTRFNSQFIRDPGEVRTEGALVSSPADGRLVVEGAEIEGEIVDIELQWDTAAQQFLIDSIDYVSQAPRANQKPIADAGPDRTVQAQDAVSLTGNGSDADGWITGSRWSQVSGPVVVLDDPFAWTVGFVAPDQAGELRFRLTVTDDQGLSDSDYLVVTVVEAEPEPEPEPEPDPGNTTSQTLLSMLDDINQARSRKQDCGGTAFPPQPPLQWSSSLAEIARLHSMDMAANGYFSHTSQDGTTMGDRVFPYWTGARVGENIAASTNSRSDGHIVDLWLDSAGHCELLMSPDWTHVGAGKAHDPDNGFTYQYFWTLDFGG